MTTPHSSLGPYFTFLASEVALRVPDCDHTMRLSVADTVMDGRVLVAQHGDDAPYEQALDVDRVMLDDGAAREMATGFARAVGNYVLGLHSNSEFGGVG